MALAPDSNKAHFFLLFLLLVWTTGILFYGFQAKMSWQVNVLWLAPLLVLMGLFSYLPITLKPLNVVLEKIKRIPFFWYLVPSVTVTSFVVAKLSLIPRDNYWPLFGIWITGILLLCLSALIEYVPPSKWRWRSLKDSIMPYRWEVVGVAVIVTFGFLIRIISLTTLPGPLAGDDGSNSLAAMSVNEGQLRNMFSIVGPYEHPAMYIFILAPFHRVFPPEIATRLPSVIIGALSIIIFYIFIRLIWKSRLLAFGATIYLATYHYHQHYSRMGLPNIADLVFVPLALLFAWRALNVGRKGDFLLMGLTIGLSMYFYTGARLSIFVTLAYLGFFAFWKKSFWKKHALNIALAVLACSVALLPIWLYWDATNSSFIKRYYLGGALNPGWIDNQKAQGGHFVEYFINNAKETTTFFFFGTEKWWGFYRPPIPLVDPLTLPFFFIGILFCLIKFWEQRRFMLLIMFFGSLFGGGVFTLQTHSGRLLLTIPAIAAFTFLGIIKIVKIARCKKARYVVYLILTALVAYNLWFYLYVYGHGRLYSDWNTWMQYELGKYVETLPRETHIIYYNPGTLPTNNPPLKLRFRKYHHYDVYEDGHMEVKPPPEFYPRIFIFPRVERESDLKDLQIACPGGDLRVFHDEKGKLLFKTYEFLNGSTCLPPAITKLIA